MASKSTVRKSTPNPVTSRFDDDEDLFPKSSNKKVSFADKKGVGSLLRLCTAAGCSPVQAGRQAVQHSYMRVNGSAGGSSRSKSPFGDESDDDKPASKFKAGPRRSLP